MSSSVEKLQEFKNQRRKLSYKKLNTLRKDAKLCDVTLKATDGDEIHAHKCVLVSNSEYFEKMFTGGFKETNQKIICIENISDISLRSLIDFIYTGELVTIDEDNVESLLNGADILQLTDVVDLCVTFYLRSIDDDNCFIIKDIADSRMITRLSTESFKYILRRFNSISQGAAFLNANIKQIIQILEKFEYNRRGERVENVYEAIIKWVKHNENDRKHFLPELLRLIKLTGVSQTYAYQKIITEPLIKSNPECMELVKKQFKHFNFEDEDPLSTKSKSNKKSFVKNPVSVHPIRLPRIKNIDPCSPCRGENAIDLFALLDRSTTEFQTSEWSILMNEDNFLKEWDEEWEDRI